MLAFLQLFDIDLSKLTPYVISEHAIKGAQLNLRNKNVYI